MSAEELECVKEVMWNLNNEKSRSLLCLNSCQLCDGDSNKLLLIITKTVYEAALHTKKEEL